MKKHTILNCLGCLVTLGIVICAFVYVTDWSAARQYDKRVAEEHFTEQDTYKMSVYSEKNSDKVLDALKYEDTEAIEKLMTESVDVEPLFDYVNWSDMVLKSIKTLGGGSYMDSPDDSGRMDFGDIFWVKVDGKKYVLYIQTVCSRWGKANDGVQSIAVTTWEHYDAIDWSWEWQEDDQTIRIGTPYPGYK